MKKAAIVVGTRPEAIKMASIILEGKTRPGIEISVWNTGQHRHMVQPVLDSFQIEASADLGLMSAGQKPGAFFAKAIDSLTSQIEKEKPDLIFVQGDTVTAAAAAAAAFFERIPVAHIEAGLRTNDLESPWPEEYNRRLISVSARWHFPPTETARQNLAREGIPEERIRITSNSGIDALLLMRDKLATSGGAKIREKWAHLNGNNPLILCTLHRREAFGAPLRNVMSAILELSRKTEAQFVLPLHPNPEVRKAASEIFTHPAPNLLITNPLEYDEFVWLMCRSTLLLTDSGGIQEEAPTLGKPVVVTREKTERPEAVSAGSALLVGTDTSKIVAAVQQILQDEKLRAHMSVARPIFGDGKAAKHVWDTVCGSLN